MGGVNEAAHILSLMGGQAKITLFDQEKIAEIHDYNVAKAARQEGREEGIRAMVSTLRSMSVAQKQIAQKLVEQFGLLPQAAEEKVKQYWKQ